MSPFSLTSATLFAVIFSAGSSPLKGPSVDLVNQIIYDINAWLEDHLQTETQLPDLGRFFFEPLKLRNGKLGEFNTIQLEGIPEGEDTVNTDKTITTTFDVKVSLKELSVNYDYELNLFGYQTGGVVTLTPQKNEIELNGIVVLGTGYCDARLDGFKISKLGEYKIDLTSDDETTHITEILRIYLSPIILSLINTPFEGFLYNPNAQSNFEDLVCKKFKSISKE